jgi:hypothetical protein
MTDSPRDWREALAYGRAQHEHPTEDWKGMCQRFTRKSYAIEFALFGSAIAQWNGADPEDRHAGGHPSDAPVGSALCYAGGRFGHIMPAARPFGNGVEAAWSNDLVHTGKIDKVARTAPITAWGHTYLGYLTAVNDVDLRYRRPQNKRYVAIQRAIANLETSLHAAKAQHDTSDVKVLTAELDRLHKLYDTLRRY